MLLKPFALACIALSAMVSAQYAYVTDQGGNFITPVDTSNDSLQSPIVIEATANDIVITPDGTTAYMTRLSPSPGVSIVDVTTQTLITSDFTDPHFVNPSHLAVSPDGTQLFVADQRANDVVVFDISNRAAPAFLYVITGFAAPAGIALYPNGQAALVTDRTTNTLSHVDLTTTPPTVVSVSGAFSGPMNLAITPDGTKAYVANARTGVIPVHLTVFPPVASAPILGSFPTSISAGNKVAISPDGTKAYVIYSQASQAVAIDTATDTVEALMPNVAGNGIGFTPDGTKAYACATASNAIIPIQVATDTPSTPVAGFYVPFGVAFVPDQAPVAAFTWSAGASTWAVNFNAQASSSPVGTIASYQWDFGDTQTLSTSSPTTTHQYAYSGSYSVTLTVTNTQGTSTTQTYTGQIVSNNGGASAQTVQNVTI